MPLDECDCLTAKYKHLLLMLEDEPDFEKELEYTAFNFCPFCGKKVERTDPDGDTTIRSMLEVRGERHCTACD